MDGRDHQFDGSQTVTSRELGPTNVKSSDTAEERLRCKLGGLLCLDAVSVCIRLSPHLEKQRQTIEHLKAAAIHVLLATRDDDGTIQHLNVAVPEESPSAIEREVPVSPSFHLASIPASERDWHSAFQLGLTDTSFWRSTISLDQRMWVKKTIRACRHHLFSKYYHRSFARCSFTEILVVGVSGLKNTGHIC